MTSTVTSLLISWASSIAELLMKVSFYLSDLSQSKSFWSFLNIFFIIVVNYHKEKAFTETILKTFFSSLSPLVTNIMMCLWQEVLGIGSEKVAPQSQSTLGIIMLLPQQKWRWQPMPFLQPSFSMVQRVSLRDNQLDTGCLASRVLLGVTHQPR